MKACLPVEFMVMDSATDAENKRLGFSAKSDATATEGSMVCF
jgi:hypothetical protein